VSQQKLSVAADSVSGMEIQAMRPVWALTG
jgi:hypothetical protein